MRRWPVRFSSPYRLDMSHKRRKRRIVVVRLSPWRRLFIRLRADRALITSMKHYIRVRLIFSCAIQLPRDRRYNNSLMIMERVGIVTMVLWGLDYDISSLALDIEYEEVFRWEAVHPIMSRQQVVQAPLQQIQPVQGQVTNIRFMEYQSCG